MAELFNSYRSQVNLAGLIELCESEGKRVIYEKGDYLLHQGYIERHISLVKSGYCRYTCLKSDGSEAVVGLAMTGEFVTDFNNGVKKIPSLVSQVASVRTEVLQLPLIYALEKLCQSDPNFLYIASDALFRTCYARFLTYMCFHRQNDTSSSWILILTSPRQSRSRNWLHISKYLINTFYE